MSRYTSPGKELRYRLIVGIDNMLSVPSLFGQVIDLGWATNGQIDEQAIIGDTPDEGMMVWIGGSISPLRDIRELVAALAPYGDIPLTLQLQLIQELDLLAPFSISALGSQLAVICQRAPEARLIKEPGQSEEVFLILNEQGWQMRLWQDIAGK